MSVICGTKRGVYHRASFLSELKSFNGHDDEEFPDDIFLFNHDDDDDKYWGFAGSYILHVVMPRIEVCYLEVKTTSDYNLLCFLFNNEKAN